METNRHAVHTQRLDRLVEVDLALFDVVSLRLQLLRDVGRRDRAEELALVADARRERQRDLLELFSERLRGAAALVLGGFEALPLLLDTLQVAGRRFVRQTMRQQIVPRVAGLDVHDVAGLAEVLDGLAKNDFHESAPIESPVRRRVRRSGS